MSYNLNSKYSFSHLRKIQIVFCLNGEYLEPSNKSMAFVHEHVVVRIVQFEFRNRFNFNVLPIAIAPIPQKKKRKKQHIKVER